MPSLPEPDDELVTAVAQFTAVADVPKNLRRMEELAAAAADQGARLVVFPEASMCAWDAPAQQIKTTARTAGPLNCYDLRFPEMARALVDRGADVLVVSAAWVAGPHKEMHWEVLLRARAIENTCYVLGSSQPPPSSAGLSTIIDPLGITAATCVGLEGVAVQRLERHHLRRVRETVPSLQHRRYQVATGRGAGAVSAAD